MRAPEKILGGLPLGPPLPQHLSLQRVVLESSKRVWSIRIKTCGISAGKVKFTPARAHFCYQIPVQLLRRPNKVWT